MARRRPTRRRKTRRYGPSTRAGQRRKTARLAYSKRRPNPRKRRAPARRRRRNPRKMIIGTPAFRYGASALGGAVFASWLNRMALERIATAGEPGNTTSAGMLEWFVPEIGDNGSRLHAGVLGSVSTFALALFLPKLKAQTRNTLIAAGTGMLTQPAIDAVGRIGTGGAMHNLPGRPHVSRLSAPRQQHYNSAVHYNASAARFAGVRSS